MTSVELVLEESHQVDYRRKKVTLSSYRVLLDGKEIGKVARRMITRERRTPGRRYVDARWESPGWRYGSVSDGRPRWEVTSRREGVERLLREADSTLRWGETEALAREAVVRK